MTSRPLPRLDRRRFLGLSAVALAAAACGGGGSTRESLNRDRDVLRVLNWSDYVDPSEDGLVGTVERFQQSTGIPTTYSPDYVGNFEALDGVLAPLVNDGDAIGFDVVTPTYWLVAQLVADDLLDPVPLDLVPNHVNVDPAFLAMPWDRGGRFHMPWQVGMTGLAYNRRTLGEGAITKTSDLFDPALAGRVSLVGEMREAVGLMMLEAGQDPSNADADEANAALDRIEEANDRGQFHSFNFGGLGDPTSFTELLLAGTIDAAMAWSGDIVQIQADNPDIVFVIPDDGAIRWFDSMVIPRGAANRGAAGEWMNFVYDPVQAAQLTAWVQYISPVLGVQDELRSQGLGDIADDPLIFPDDATARRLVTFNGRSLAEENALDTRFAEIAGF